MLSLRCVEFALSLGLVCVVLCVVCCVMLSLGSRLRVRVGG